jgi:predicted PurR-regulated permease PerM
MNKTLLPWLRTIFVFTAAIVITLIVFFKVKGILMPFFLSFVFAYCFDGIVVKFDKKGIPRHISSLIIVLGFFGSFLLMATLLTPILYSQFKSLVLKTPHYIEQFDNQFIPILNQRLSDVLGREVQIDGVNQSIMDKFNTYSQNFSNQIVNWVISSGKKIATIVSMALLTPILCFYLLKDFSKVTIAFSKLIPNRYKDDFSDIQSNIKTGITSYLKGQFYLILILSSLYTAGLLALGLDYWFLIGFCTGIFAIIPYIGFFIWLVIGCLIAAFQFKDLMMVVLTLAIFLSVQLTDASFLTPRIMSSKIGVHPLWIIFGMLVFGVLFGFLGVFFAMPLTVITATLIKFFAKAYFASEYYQSKHSL